MMEDKWKYGIIPGFILHFALGTIYSWSVMEKQVSIVYGIDSSSIFIIFTLFVGVFSFLLSPFVEKNIKCSVKLCSILYISGIILCNISAFLQNYFIFSLGFLGFMASSVGIGYLIPIKNLSLWVKDKIGLAIGLALMGFSLSRGLVSMIYYWMLSNFESDKHIIIGTTLIIGIINLVLIIISSFFLRPPENHEEHKDCKLCLFYQSNYLKDLLSPIKRNKALNYYGLIFFSILPVSILLFSKGYYMTTVGIQIAEWSLLIGLIVNILGRVGSSILSDRIDCDKMICILIYIGAFSCLVGYVFSNDFFITSMIDVNTFCYGAIFTLIPIALFKRYGVSFIARSSGLALFVWTLGSVIGNHLSSMVHKLPDHMLNTIILVFIILYIVGLEYSTGIWEKK